MSYPSSPPAAPRRSAPLRVWPGAVVVAALLLVRFVLPVSGGTGILGAMIGAVAVLAWWLAFSRARWIEKLGALGLMAAALALAARLVHPSIANGMMGLMPLLFAIPLFCLALVVWAAVAGRFSPAGRLALLAATIAVAVSLLTLVRTEGVTGDADSQLHWRWTPTPEERLLAATESQAVPEVAAGASPAAAGEPAARAAAGPPPAADTSAAAEPGAATAAADPAPATAAGTSAAAPAISRAEWPGFRGTRRDSTVRGVRIAADWSQSPPRELWRRPIGPGWSSFAVRGARVYTQEQRGEDELVSCYDLGTGEPVWQHRDAVRFWESNAGAGPRGTPAIHGGRLYTVGATGIINALDGETGRPVWSRNIGTDTGARVPDWGFASSPLVFKDLVIVAASSHLIAYDRMTGEPRWRSDANGGSYSSPQMLTLAGVPQVLLVGGASTIGVDPESGTVLWEHGWDVGAGIVQPAVTAEGDVLIAPGDAMGGAGIRRVTVSKGPEGWTTTERWTSRGLKPYFNDFVVHEGHAYGFDGSILASIDLASGERSWKGGRYGHGQLLLLPEQDLLLILSEEGELVLVAATPDAYTEVARVPALQGKTWNHPVLVGDVLLVRNGEVMAAYRLPSAAGKRTSPSD